MLATNPFILLSTPHPWHAHAPVRVCVTCGAALLLPAPHPHPPFPPSPRQYQRRDGRRSIAANTPVVINSLLKDSQQQWTRRRESITNIRMQAKLGATNLNNHLPWREVQDANQAVSIAAEFLYGAVEPVAGSERGTFRGGWVAAVGWLAVVAVVVRVREL
jgi:hypothetical protein